MVHLAGDGSRGKCVRDTLFLEMNPNGWLLAQQQDEEKRGQKKRLVAAADSSAGVAFWIHAPLKPFRRIKMLKYELKIFC